MLNLNLSNVEELIFYDHNICKKLPEFDNLFKIWAFSVKNSLNPLGKKALMDFLITLKNDHIVILEGCLGDKIVVDRLDYHIARDYRIPIGKAEEQLNSIQGFQNLSIYRNETQLYISFWR